MFSHQSWVALRYSAWEPAKNAKGEPVLYRTDYDCGVKVKSPYKELQVREIGSIGPLIPEQIWKLLADDLPELSRCFESALRFDKRTQGRHEVAFEVLKTGRVGRVEWVEQLLADEAFQECVFGILRRWRFPAAEQGTIASIKIHVGGVNIF